MTCVKMSQKRGAGCPQDCGQNRGTRQATPRTVGNSDKENLL